MMQTSPNLLLEISSEPSIAVRDLSMGTAAV